MEKEKLPDRVINNFLEKAKAAHNNKYTYDNATFEANSENVIVTCPIHGDWETSRHRHINATIGCPECAKLARRENFIKEVIVKAKAIYGDRYTYDKSFSSPSGIIATCQIHGDWTTTPREHITLKRGCPKCGKLERYEKAKRTFFEKAKAKHGDRYDYSKVNYVRDDEHVIVICKIHGEFPVTPGNHTRGTGCPKCAHDALSHTLDHYIDRAKEVHGDRYDYSEIIGNPRINDKVPIKCKIHGVFKQPFNEHIHAGHGCPICGQLVINEKHSLSQDEVLKRFTKVHGDRYDYSKFVYTGKKNNGIIICREHGEFLQAPGNHVNGAGCPKCAGKYQLTKDEWLAKAKEYHGDKYDYSETIYPPPVENKGRVNIICKIHGKFNIRAREHTGDNIHRGCPICSSSYGERTIAEYFLKENINFIKEYTLPGYRYRYDFYLPEYNLFIEYHGRQHYMDIDHFGGNKALIETKKNDKHKAELIEIINGANLITIPYTKEDVLLEYLLYSISRYYKYKDGNIFYKNFSELCRAKNLPLETKPGELTNYLTYKK